MPFKLLNEAPRPCPLIARALERYAFRVEVEERLPRESSEPEPEYRKVDCSITAYPPYGEETFASLYFVKGRLLDGDVIVEHNRAGDVLQALKRAQSCNHKETHFHGPEKTPELHFHLEGCNIVDLGKVLEAGGYR